MQLQGELRAAGTRVYTNPLQVWGVSLCMWAWRNRAFCLIRLSRGSCA